MAWGAGDLLTNHNEISSSVHGHLQQRRRTVPAGGLDPVHAPPIAAKVETRWIHLSGSMAARLSRSRTRKTQADAVHIPPCDRRTENVHIFATARRTRNFPARSHRKLLKYKKPIVEGGVGVLILHDRVHFVCFGCILTMPCR
jgi:hypothetical protein